MRKPATFQGNEHLSSDVLASGIKTIPNKTFLGLKPALGFYNLGQTIKTDSSLLKKVYHRLDRQQYYEERVYQLLTNSLGEAPHIIEKPQLIDDVLNLQSIYFAEGYMNAQVRARIKRSKWNRHQAEVVFLVQENRPFIIRQVRYVSEDSTLLAYERGDSLNRRLKPGNLCRESDLTDERVRIANVMKEFGYFKFGADAIRYSIDTTLTWSAQDSLRFKEAEGGGRRRGTKAKTDKNEPKRDTASSSKAVKHSSSKKVDKAKPTAKTPPIPHPVDILVLLPDEADFYTLKEVNATLRKPGQSTTDKPSTFDLLKMTPGIRSAYNISSRWLRPEYDVKITTLPEVARELNLNLIARRMRLHNGDVFTLRETRRTQQLLQGLGVFRNVVISYTPIDSTRELIANIDLPLLRAFNFSVGAEVFQSRDARLNNANLPGFGASFNARNRNTFGHAENLELTLNSSVSLYRPNPDASQQPFYQVTARANFSVPRLFPVETPKRNFINFRPTTTFSLAYSEEVRVEYQRRGISTDFQYQWFNIPFSNRSQIQYTPLNLLFVQTTTNAAFTDFLNSLPNSSIRQFIERDFKPRLATKAALYYTYSANYAQTRLHPTWWIRPGIEMGGNIPFLIDWITRQTGAYRSDTTSLSDNRVFNQYIYGQFIRGSFEARLFVPVGRDKDWVSRFYAGTATGILNTRIIPFENRFFAGGTSSVRGWQSGTLGPGTYAFPDGTVFANLIAPGGELIVEMSTEYRFKIISIIKGALFLDAGNVWFWNNSSGFTGGNISANTLQLGVAGGIGFRFDLSFFIFRLDFGQQLYAPDVQRWIVQNLRDIGGTRLQWNIGIGYPF